MSTEPILKLDKISQHFLDERGRVSVAIKDISFSIAPGEFISLIGPSGSGKTTLLRIISRLHPPHSGTIEIGYRQLAMVFQGYGIFPWLSVLDNVAYGLAMQGVEKKRRHAIAREKIIEVELEGHEHKYPHELSGGMRQRVSIARALAINPDFLIMDEPFSSLDSITSEALKKDILRLWEKYKMTIFMVSHIVADAVELSDRVIVLSGRPGTVQTIFDVQLSRPRGTRSNDFYHLSDKLTEEVRRASISLNI